MDDLGNIIYLLIIVGAVISGLIKKGRKANPEVNPRPVATEQEENDDWKDIFKQYTPEEQQPQPVYQAPQPTTNYDDLRIKKRFTIVDEEETNEETANIMSEINLATPSDAKTAFVYAEILTRKY